MGEQQTAGILHYGDKDTHAEHQCQIRTGCLILHVQFVINRRPGHPGLRFIKP